MKGLVVNVGSERSQLDFTENKIFLRNVTRSLKSHTSATNRFTLVVQLTLAWTSLLSHVLSLSFSFALYFLPSSCFFLVFSFFCSLPLHMTSQFLSCLSFFCLGTVIIFSFFYHSIHLSTLHLWSPLLFSSNLSLILFHSLSLTHSKSLSFSPSLTLIASPSLTSTYTNSFFLYPLPTHTHTHTRAQEHSCI